jgi:methylphosphotriester-DNA--protein-cysteine methyltransferase
LQDISQNRVLTGPAACQSGGANAAELGKVLSVLSAVDELAACRETNSMLRLATELARERLGLERVGLYMRDRGVDRIIMRGTWGTGCRGETTDERTLFHECAPSDYDALLGARLGGGLGMYHAHAPLFANDTGRPMVIGEGWMMATPLVAAGDVVGVMYNDAALTRSPIDESKQAAVAVLCTLLAALYLSKRGTLAWQPLPQKSGQSPLVERIIQALTTDLPITGECLANELGVSPGHLARSFKREMGVSLVDYRNRLRIDRFFESIQRERGTCNLLDAALEAGFGSYAQFHRVYRKFLGTTPRDIFSNGPNGGIRTALAPLDASSARSAFAAPSAASKRGGSEPE